MRRKLRITVTLLALVCGIAVSVRLDTGRNELEPEPAAYSAADTPIFEVSLRRGTLLLAGHTVSDRHEEQLRQAAAANFPGATLRTAFRPLGVLPGWWDRATLELLSALPGIESPIAILEPERLGVRGLLENPATAEKRLLTIRNMLPDSAAVDLQFARIASDTTLAEICARQFAVFDAGTIEFEESGIDFRAAAYPLLDRIVTLADACRDATVSITGHTDSTGNETHNQELSLERARAVAAYLAETGIDPDRMVVTGAGSSLPIASNATRYGRSLNRRIDVHMTRGRPD